MNLHLMQLIPCVQTLSSKGRLCFLLLSFKRMLGFCSSESNKREAESVKVFLAFATDHNV